LKYATPHLVCACVQGQEYHARLDFGTDLVCNAEVIEENVESMAVNRVSLQELTLITPGFCS
jgi:hypothetical protein